MTEGFSAAKTDADLPACCSFRHGLRRATFLREEGFGFPRSPTCLSLWERCRAATERAGSLVREFCQIDKIRMRFALMQTCLRAAPSVTACAAPPSSGRKASVLTHKPTCLSLWERFAQRQRRLAPSLRELDRLSYEVQQ